MIFVAFGHRKETGKDTCAKFLCSHLRTITSGKSIQIEQFSRKLKDVCYQLYYWAGLKPAEFYEVEEHKHLKNKVLPKIGKSPRQIWIEMGTNVARVVYPETWVEYLWHNISCDVLIVSDMRFVNEAERILSYGGYCFRVDRQEAPNDSDVADDDLANYTKWSAIINNHGEQTKSQLYKQITELANTYILPKLD